MERRTFLRAVAASAGTAAFSGSLWQGAALAAPAQPGPSPYGPLQPQNANGIQLPAGFTSRVIATSGKAVANTGYKWHNAPDGGACFVDGTGWCYVSNSEIDKTGGASVIRFDANGDIRAAERILAGTNRNCAGGATPWDTWLSGEEIDRGFVYETDPVGGKPAAVRPAMGRFMHEAAACDPVRKVVYLTEDERDGCFYRFRPAAWGDLSAGVLEVLVGPAGTSGPVSWVPVPDPSATATRTRKQVAAAKKFNGGEGCYYAENICWFTTKGDNRVWAYNAAAQTIDLAYDASAVPGRNAPLTGVDNITGARTGDLFVAEDGGNMEINIITPAGVVAPFLRINGQSWSEITGPAFSPDGRKLYFSSQRGATWFLPWIFNVGYTYEVTGPFRGL